MAAYVAHLLNAAGQLCWHIVAVQHFRSVQYTSFSVHLLAWCSMKTCVIKHKLCYAAFKSVFLFHPMPAFVCVLVEDNEVVCFVATVRSSLTRVAT